MNICKHKINNDVIQKLKIILADYDLYTTYTIWAIPAP